MNTPPPLLTDQQKYNADHLNLLAIFHFIGAGLALLGFLFIALHYMFFHTVVANHTSIWVNQGQGQVQMPPMPFRAMFAIFRSIYLIFGVWFAFSGVLNVISGMCLLSRKCRTFSLVVAAIDCMHIPFGTALGVFTIIVLTRNSVRDMYGG